MFNNKKIIVSCSKETKRIIKNRASQLEMSVSLYLEYLALKDIADTINK